jgi:hypothetical protein
MLYELTAQAQSILSITYLLNTDRRHSTLKDRHRPRSVGIVPTNPWHLERFNSRRSERWPTAEGMDPPRPELLTGIFTGVKFSVSDGVRPSAP